jgi:succinate dehydrogenase flavin-adding protein (antitoxin of CptAB toxin-antitoxin module)
MDLLVAALAGGAAGAAIAALARVPSQVRAHDRLVAEYDEELGNWVADESVRLERELKRATRRLTESDETGEHAHARALAQVKEESLRAYRDSELAARNQRTALRDTEDWQHDLWRWVTARGQLPPLRMPRKAKPIIDSWREPVSFGDVSVEVNDPTSRGLDELLAELAEKQAAAEEGRPRTPQPGEHEARRAPSARPQNAGTGEQVRQ